MEMNGIVKITGEKIKTQMNTDEIYNKKADNNVENDKSLYSEDRHLPEIIMLNEAYSQCEKLRAYLGQKRNSAAERTLTGHLLGNNLRALSQTNIALSTDVTDALKFIASEFNKINTHNSVLSAGKTSIPDAELWEMIADSINEIDENYMDVYEQAIQEYMEFFSAFSDAISEMSKYITSYDGDENYPITINYIGLFNCFYELYVKYSNTILFETTSKEEAEQWVAEWGPAVEMVTIVPSQPDPDDPEVFPNETYYEVRLDMSPVESILMGIGALFYPGLDGKDAIQDLKKVVDILTSHNVDINDNNAVANALKDNNIKKEIEQATGIKNFNDLYFSSAEYQAFQAGFDAQEQVIQTSMQTLTQKYNTAVSLVDNLYKILSSTISSCTETLKAYLTN